MVTNLKMPFEDVPLVELTYFVFTRMPGDSYRRRLGSLLLCLCDVFRAVITPLVLILRSFEHRCQLADDFRRPVVFLVTIVKAVAEGRMS